jgi:pimeloyl-ACP methyl ester carboxylesterase
LAIIVGFSLAATSSACHARIKPGLTSLRALAAVAASGQAPPEVSVPVGFTTFPGEVWAAPRSWVEQSYPTLTYFNKVDKGGHFAAWEEPELFASEVRAAFRSLR